MIPRSRISCSLRLHKLPLLAKVPLRLNFLSLSYDSLSVMPVYLFYQNISKLIKWQEQEGWVWTKASRTCSRLPSSLWKRDVFQIKLLPHVHMWLPKRLYLRVITYHVSMLGYFPVIQAPLEPSHMISTTLNFDSWECSLLHLTDQGIFPIGISKR